jgi:hypothetical protein
VPPNVYQPDNAAHASRPLSRLSSTTSSGKPRAPSTLPHVKRRATFAARFPDQPCPVGLTTWSGSVWLPHRKGGPRAALLRVAGRMRAPPAPHPRRRPDPLHPLPHQAAATALECRRGHERTATISAAYGCGAASNSGDSLLISAAPRTRTQTIPCMLLPASRSGT